MVQDKALTMKSSCQKYESELIKPLDVTVRPLFFFFFYIYHWNDQITIKDSVYPGQLIHTQETVRFVIKSIYASVCVKKEEDILCVHLV